MNIIVKKVQKSILVFLILMACVERMFSIEGDILSLKRRLLGIQVLMDFVWLKLNEAFY